ncbi:GOLPH3/VPS74 family protein [Baia soyae]|uniref:Golgi phosphoprotein 3 GPP34 n=1 Tax=Baia soyae TaxID=1544746 RepID=A0A4V6NRT7_9BACL|nr:GPP34 family phosphoprotein [Baia soyae]TCP69279.1 Golgi phosphoprotein 3 GPP34 [Baia soyae]
MRSLSLVEEIVLFCLDRRAQRFKGNDQTYKELYTIGSVFIELWLKELIQINEDGKVRLDHSYSTGVDYLDQVIQVISESPKEKTIKKWITSFYYKRKDRKKIYQTILMDLCQVGVVREENARLLGVFSRQIFVGSGQEQERTVRRIRAELLGNSTVEKQTVALSLFLKEMRVLKEYFSNHDMNRLKEKMKELKQDEVFQWIKGIEKAITAIKASAHSHTPVM